jgi:hypothetical protein
MNVKLLRKIKKHILEQPKRLLMGRWIVNKGDYATEKVRFAKCETAACIAGWACILAGQGKPQDVSLTAEKLLGLGWRQASRLFQPLEWPDKFDAGLLDNGTAKTAKMAARRIEHFIKTKGRE